MPPPFDRNGALTRAARALRQGRIDAAIAEYVRLTEAEPLDASSAHVLGDLYARAGQTARAVAQYARTADQLAADGRSAEALRVFHKGLTLKPDDRYVAARVAEVSRQIGLETPADEVVPADGAPWITMAEAALTDGRLQEGRDAVAQAMRTGIAAKEAAMALACRVAASAPDAAYQVIDVLVDRALDEDDPSGAVAVLQEFVARVRHHPAALVRLVDVSMEAGLETSLHDAQGQLADAYLDAGRGLEACAVSEDLVAREPWNRANLERYRKAMGLLGEPDPDAVIAGRLGGDAPFLASDLGGFRMQARLDNGGGVLDVADVAAPAPAPVRAVTSRATEAEALARFRLGLASRDIGLVEDAVEALEAATAGVDVRARAAWALAAIHRAAGREELTVDWLQRAAAWVPAATDISRAVRYDLGGALETVGDHDRALAVFTGLEAEQSGYRDVTVRVQRLLASTPRG